MTALVLGEAVFPKPAPSPVNFTLLAVLHMKPLLRPCRSFPKNTTIFRARHVPQDEDYAVLFLSITFLLPKKYYNPWLIFSSNVGHA